MDFTLAARRVVTLDGVLSPGTVEVVGGRIAAVHTGGGSPADVTLVPGFVDVQVNGIGPVDVARAQGTDWDELNRRLVAQGVTAWCPTLVTQPLADFAAPLRRIEAASATATAAAAAGTPTPAILGAHLEGPFLGGAPGAHRREWIVDIDFEWLAALPAVVQIVTLAPEVPNACEAIGVLSDQGVVVSMGHSGASYEEAVAGAGAGARLVTHCFNGMTPLHHRHPGLVGAALTDRRLRVGMIADLVHVHPAAIALAFAAKGRHGVVLVTDAVGWESGSIAGRGLRVEDGAPRLQDGTLAGSCLTMDLAVANTVRAAGVGFEDAIRAASTNPADLLGCADRGRIAAGCRADLVALDDDFMVETTWIGGVEVYRR